MAKVDKWFLVCNPIARSGKMKDRWPEVQHVLKKQGIDYDFSFTKANNHAISLTQEKIREGYRKFAVLGGDGTINEVINGIFNQKEVNQEEILFALIPLGTANDWARTHNISHNLNQSIRLLKQGKIKIHDVGLATYALNQHTKQRYFINVAGMAYDAFVVKYIEAHGNRKMNKLKYLYYVLRCLFMFKLPKAKIEFGEQIVESPVYTINVGICKYNGGGLRLVPQAVPDDGKLALTIAKKLTKLQVILNMYRFYTGTIGNMKQVLTTHTDQVEITQPGADKILLELDGEFMGYAPVRFEILPGALRFLS